MEHGSSYPFIIFPAISHRSKQNFDIGKYERRMGDNGGSVGSFYGHVKYLIHIFYCNRVNPSNYPSAGLKTTGRNIVFDSCTRNQSNLFKTHTLVLRIFIFLNFEKTSVNDLVSVCSFVHMKEYASDQSRILVPDLS